MKFLLSRTTHYSRGSTLDLICVVLVSIACTERTRWWSRSRRSRFKRRHFRCRDKQLGRGGRCSTDTDNSGSAVPESRLLNRAKVGVTSWIDTVPAMQIVKWKSWRRRPEQRAGSWTSFYWCGERACVFWWAGLCNRSVWAHWRVAGVIELFAWSALHSTQSRRAALVFTREQHPLK